MHSVELSREATKAFERASASLQRKLDRCFDQLKVDPRQHSNIKQLKGPLAGKYRYRVGDYRVIYRINEQDQTVSVVKIVHRSEAYGVS
ncbi:MAG: type II toxin-antitoxin system RelE/ParE family toxin [Pirellulales bacterium]